MSSRNTERENVSSPIFIALPKGESVKDIKSSIPVSCLYLCDFLKKHGIDSELVDFSVEMTKAFSEYTDAGLWIYTFLHKKFSSKMPLWVGINCFTTTQFLLICDISRRLKQTFADIKICVGGMHPSLFAEDILKHCPYIDYVAIGEGEEQTLGITRYLRGELPAVSQLQAFAYRNAANEVVVNPREHFMERLETLSADVWHKIDLKKYYVDTRKWNNPNNLAFNVAVPIMTTRSCPFSCSFCSVAGFMGKKLRFCSPKDIVDEVEYIHNEFGENYFEFIDDNINVKKEHALAIFRGLKERKLNIHFSLTNGIHLASADEELIDAMVEAGLAMMKFPIEHGNDFIRNSVVGKNLKREKIVSLSKYIKQFDVFTFGLFIMGFPEDTPDTLNDSLQLMDEISLDMYPTALLIPFPGTKIYAQCVRDKLLLHDICAEELYTGRMMLDAFGDSVYIKPYKMSVDSLREYKRMFDAKHAYSERAKEINKKG